MFIEMIDRHMFQEFIRNSTATVLEGNFVTGSARTHYYRIVRVPLAIGEHYIEALYGHQCYSGPNSMGSTIFSTNDPLEFMAFVVDHKDFYNETYQFLTLFDDSWVNIQPHGTSNSMATALWQYLDNKTVLGESDLQDASLQREAYVVENSSISEIPQQLLDDQRESYRQEIQAAIASYDMTEDEYFQQVGVDSMDALLDTYADQIKESVSDFLIFQAVAEEQKIKVTDDDVSNYFGGDALSVKQAKAYYGEAYLNQNVLYEKVYTWLVDHASIV